jgi:minor extracellular serine protease Vpr
MCHTKAMTRTRRDTRPPFACPYTFGESLMKMRLNSLALAALAVLLPLPPTAWAQSVSVEAAENGRLWFVELSGAPTADGNSKAAVQAEKRAFRNAAAAAGVRYQERRSFDVLFNGFAIAIDVKDRSKLMQLPGVKAVYPIERIAAPTVEEGGGSALDLATAIQMTGAHIAQASGLTGQGIKVGIIDSGIDVDHPAFGGGGVPGQTPFPSARVVAGYDFVGDNYDSSSAVAAKTVPNPDANPDDCGGHGSHVAGIVGANGVLNGSLIKGVAPAVSFGAYRVFGCEGTTDSDILLAALELAYADGMQVINQSLGAARQWPQYPTAQASSRLVDKGVVMVASIGNNGPGGGSPDGLFAAGAPGVGDKVIGVASYDNTFVTQPAFTVDPGGQLVGFTASAGGTAAVPTSGSLPMARTGTPTSTADGCTVSGAPAPGSLTGKAVLIRRGTCGFYEKAFNAQVAGAAAVVLYNNAAGFLSPSVAPAPAGAPTVNIPVVMVTNTDGVTLNGKIAAGPTTLTWGTQLAQTPSTTGGLISGFSSFGLSATLALKPNLGAPGGSIYSSYPLEKGGGASLSGTSMSSPHVAGAAALLLQSNPRINSHAMVARMQNSADPTNWSGNPGLGFLDFTFRQGAGMLDIMGSVQATTSVEPSQLSLGESEAGPATRTLTIRNTGASAVSYTLSHSPALSANTNGGTASYAPGSTTNTPATVSFSAPSVSVPAGASASVDVTIAANAALADRALYGGYIVMTPVSGGATYRVPYAGMKGDYQGTRVLTPTANGFPWLAQLGGGFFNNRPTGATFTLIGEDIPFFLLHLDHLSRQVRLEAFDAASGASRGLVSKDEYVTRNSTPGGFFQFTWDGNTFTGKGKNASQRLTVANGQYVVKLSVLKALGDEANPAHWETWTSPVITIARP